MGVVLEGGHQVMINDIIDAIDHHRRETHAIGTYFA